jgi:hypothetical protein
MGADRMGHRFGFAGHKAIIHTGLAAHQARIRRQQFAVAEQDMIAGLQAGNGDALIARAGFPGD